MKKCVIIAFLALPLSFKMQGCASPSQLGLVPSEFEMITGLKDALTQGMFASFDAFANPTANPLLQFAFPGDAAGIEKNLRDIGLGSVIDQATGKLTNAMRDAVTVAKPIFVHSIKQLTIKDALNILVTDNTRAATEYFKRTSQPMLMEAFRPIVDSTVRVKGADRDFNRLATAYNAIPFSRQKLETNLTDFIAARAIDGMMLVIGNEEEKIRTKYEFRKTDMMKKAFGYAEQELKRKQAARQE